VPTQATLALVVDGRMMTKRKEEQHNVHNNDREV
jgi:hypothetical protein